MIEPGTIICGDCLELMRGWPDGCVDAVITDPPYFRVKGEAWDRQWDTRDGFIEWMDTILAQCHRILKPNGSLYLFASPRMAAHVEVAISRWFDVLNRVRWIKEAGWHKKASKEDLRSYLSPWEEIIFAEHYGADQAAGYLAKTDEQRGYVFEPLRAYLDGEKRRAGFTTRRVAEAFQQRTGSRTVTGMAGHWFTQIQWTLPTEDNYLWLQQLFNNGEYKYLRREYEDLRREYEDLRRPFNVTGDVPYTDVWTFPTVQAYPGKHPCEKPLEMMEHIITASTRDGALILDPFCGSGSTLVAAERLGRRWIGIDIDEHWCEVASKRTAQRGLFNAD